MNLRFTPSGSPQTTISYRLMVVFMRLMKKKRFVMTILQKSKVTPDSIVLDYACGPGIFTIPAAKIAVHGHIYAADIHPLAIRDVLTYASREHLDNIRTIQTDQETGLELGSVDVVLLFDCFHAFKDPIPILKELHRVLKDGGYLSLQVDHVDAAGPIAVIEGTGLFTMINQPAFHQLYLFQK